MAKFHPIWKPLLPGWTIWMVIFRIGANKLLINVNFGALPNDLFLEQVRRFGRDVLPKLQAHQVTRIPAVEALV